MTGRGPEALARLREIRDALGADDASSRVNLRDYAEPGSPAWDAFIEASGLPGHKVRRATMLARINQAIDALTARLLGADAPPTAAPAADAAPAASTARELERLAEVVSDAMAEARPLERQRLRRLTPDGISYARAFLADLVENPDGPIEPPRDLLYGDAYSERFVGEVEVERRRFRTRREAAEYLAPRLEPIRPLIADHAGAWSWLGMFYFADTVPVRDGQVRLPAEESFVFQDDPTTTEGRRSYQRRYRHYLRSAWQLHQQHGTAAAYLLDEPITSFNDLIDRTLSHSRIFQSVGMVPLLLRLYTDGQRTKPGYPRSPGGLRHLIRVLDQLERTYDVYGMEPDALIEVLPEEFQAWDGGPGPQAAA